MLDGRLRGQLVAGGGEEERGRWAAAAAAAAATGCVAAAGHWELLLPRLPLLPRAGLLAGAHRMLWLSCQRYSTQRRAAPLPPPTLHAHPAAVGWTAWRRWRRRCGC
jgi:hypothetical protein